MPPFTVGHPKRGGRKKGTPHKRTQRLRERLLRDEALTVESTVESIRRGQQWDIRCLYRPDGTLKELSELTEAEAWPIVGIDIVRENLKGGDGHADTVVKYRLEPRRGYVELAARHQGMLTDKLQVSGDQALMDRLDAWKRQQAEKPKPEKP